MNEKILIIDDDLSLRNLYKEILSSEGYLFFEASNVQEALLICEKERPDVVLLDIRLKGESGLTFSSTIGRDRDRFGHPKILALSAFGYEQLESGENLEKYNIDRFISKPFDISDLFLKIKHFIAKK